MASAVNGVLLVFLCGGLVSYVDSLCPRDPRQGYWNEDTLKHRCILRCDVGYEPSGCHVIRYSHIEGKWNHDVPSCQKMTLAKNVVAGVLHIPWDVLLEVARANLLLGPGFGAAGLAAWPIAARQQVTFTANRWYASSDSVIDSLFSSCEKE